MVQTYLQTIQGFQGESILLKYFLPETILYKRPVVIVHGFKGFMDWGHFPMVGQSLATSGHPVVMFNFSHNGTSLENPTEFTRLDLFSENTYSAELYDLTRVIDALSSSEILQSRGVVGDEVVLIGHSRGGGIAILQAAEDKRVKKLVTWAAVDSFTNFLKLEDDVMQEWREEGVLNIWNARTHQQMPLKYSLYEDLLQHRDRLDIEQAAKNIQVPWRIIHGEIDPTVDVKVAKRFKALQPRAELCVIPNAHHNFGAKHPLDGTENTSQIQELIACTQEFIED